MVEEEVKAIVCSNWMDVSIKVLTTVQLRIDKNLKVARFGETLLCLLLGVVVSFRLVELVELVMCQ